MKKTIQYLATAASIALFAIASPFAASGANGHIFDILPSDEFGTILSSPVASATAPLGGGEKVNFVVRMAKADASSSSTKWRLTHMRPGLSSEALDYLTNPFGIGIYVSGEIRIATLKTVNYPGDYFTDFVFEYVTKPGDFALPIVLASADGKPASDGEVTDLSYYVNPASVGVWSITDEAGAPANLWFGTPSYPTGETSSQDYCLRGAGFYVKTIDFDSNFEVPDADPDQAIWRTVHEGSTIPGGATPSLEVTGLPTNAVTLYVWSLNESGVRVDGGTLRDIHMTATTTQQRWVKEVKVVAGKLQYPFEIYGLAEGQYDYLVLSAFPDFNYNVGTFERHQDYVTVKVQCSEPLPPTIRVVPATTPVTATSNYTHYATELQVSLTQAYTEDVKVTITPSFENGAAVNWGDYIRFSDLQDITSLPEATAPTLTIKAGKLVPETKLYVFALRSDENTVGVSSHIRFTPSTDNAGAQTAIGGWDTAQGDLNINAQNPVIVTPEEGDTFLTAVAGAERTLRITVADTYADMSSDDGYEIYILKNSDTESSFTKLDGTYKPGQGGFLFKTGTTDVLPSVIYSETGANKSTIYVKSPVSGNQSEERNFVCTVSAPAGFTVTAIDGKTNNEYREGDDVSIEIELDRQNTTGGSLYAFLVPTSDKDRNAVDCSFLAQNNAIGLEIPQYGTSVVGYFTLADGCTGAANSQFTYKIELRSSAVYQDGTPVTSFMCKNTLALKSVNVIPSVDSILMGLNETNDEGVFAGIVVAKGVPQTFTANVTEPGQFDLDATGDDAFQVRWLFRTAGYSAQGPAEAPADGIIKGNPENNQATFTFNSAGRWEVTVELRDKDMANWGNGELKGKYTFYVDVVDQPAVTITGRTESGDEASSFYETEALDAGGGAYIDINLAMNKCTFPLKVELEIASGDPTSTTPGAFVLQESANIDKTGDNLYEITFAAGVTTVPAIIKTLDGTITSRTQGFILTPRVKTPTEVPESGGQPANTYYVGTAKTLKINNSTPVVEEADLYPQPGTTNFVALGAADPITWNFTDVLPDINGGITVTVKGGGGFSETVTTTAGAAGSFTPNFTQSGPQTVQLTIKDKDNGQVSFIWYYEVEVAKTLSIIPHGPAGGNGTANSKRYRTAAGLGEGRVWAKGFSAVNGFESLFNCGKSSTWTVYGYGYKVGDVDDGVNLKKYADRSTPINASGNAKGATEAGYTYVPVKDKNGFDTDSFLYTWLQITAAEEGGSLTDVIFGGATSPEYTGLTDTGTRIALPSEQNDDGSFLDTMLEAIFSREYLSTDNMGDINQDGIPDIYVDKYGMGVVDPATGTLAGDDLTSLRGYNADLPASDFLPANATAGYGTLIPGLEDTWATLGQPFTAVLEIRGYGEGLNDAPALAGIPNVKPERVYTDPTADAKSTLTYTEYLAWTEFAAANGLDPALEGNWTAWSPERPTDPTKADTDEDGFSDGYEYYFWYRAHVGYIDDNGNHRYLTGRAYDPRNPGEGRRISSAEIAERFDPLTPAADAESAATVDTDNDGLPDLLEFVLGTNPLDFDTDGDGLPDGWELMIAGTSPVTASSYLDATIDTVRNYDGDAMAFTSQFREMTGMPAPIHVPGIMSFAVIDENGDTDGKQWYVVKEASSAALTFEIDETGTGTLLKIGGASYIALGAVKVTADNRLAAAPGTVYEVTAAADVAETVPGITVEYLRLAPAELEAGTLLAEPPVENTAYAVAKVATTPDFGKCNAAWVYGNPLIENYGMLAVARYAVPETGAELCEVPGFGREVAYLHYLVYQEYGFDPRTAWSPNSPMTSRWGTTSSDGEAVEGVTVMKQGGYTATAARTRAYAMYDEFLVYSFFVNNGVDMSGTTYVTDPSAPAWAAIWGAFTTNPQGPGENGLVNEDNYYGRNSTEGADTDLDGVPDGWELYVMAGPKDKDGNYVFAPPYAGFNTGLSPETEFKTVSSHWSPFVGDADKNVTDSQLYLGGQANSDGLNQRREFGGTDSCGYYSKAQGGGDDAKPFSTTIVRHESDLKWLNKFFPSDPWNTDTDGDGIKDNAEGTTFVYGAPVDNGKLWSIPGGGLNPCSVDTDLDGLPDPWEVQYKGSTVYAGEDATYASDIEGDIAGNPLEGYIDGMDGTVPDSFNVPNYSANSVTSGDKTETFVYIRTADGRVWSSKVNRDYDRDGLENWQEYLTGTMRCWRYDDPLSSWTAIPKSAYFSTDILTGEEFFDVEKATKTFGCATADEFWYKTLVDKASGIYNPNLVTDCSSGWQYFSRVTNVWDTAYLDPALGGTSGAYYFFYNRINGDMLKDLWGEATGLIGKAPSKYMGCDPTSADTDQDGMDDYYELFHGMNPILGESGVARSSEGPCDLVADAWMSQGELAVQAWSDDLEANYWTMQVKSGNNFRGAPPKGNGYDFVYYPWLNGIATADPDGDDIRNQQEAIMPTVNINAKHTDPTPLWMTDSSYSNSLVRMFFRMPTRYLDVILGPDSFTNPDDPEDVYYFRDFPGFVPATLLSPAKFMPFAPDFWQLSAAGEENWMFSFEENEGYDSDHDGMNDDDESVARFRDAGDPLDADSPRRRQAMYFGGKAVPSILQTLPATKERYPLSTMIYPENTDFREFTVECWVKAESLDNATVIERAVRVVPSNPGDQQYVRRNFHIGIKDGRWYAAYDSAGTLLASTVEAVGFEATTEWTHLAATYDGDSFDFYVNGTLAVSKTSSVDPEYGASALVINDLSTFWGTRDYDLVAVILGASVKRGGEGTYGDALALTATSALRFENLSAYENFFQGWVDEVRIWDGARSSDEVNETRMSRFTAADAAANRQAVYDEWSQGNRRYVAGNTARAELRYHYAFDSVFGAMTSTKDDLRITPAGFIDTANSKPNLSRPDDWNISWLARVLEAHGSAYDSEIWTAWIHNTVAHLPRFDGTTIDSMYWSKDFEGWKLGSFDFPLTAEPYSKWTQMVYNQTLSAGSTALFATPGARHKLINLNPDAQGFDISSNETWAVDYKTRFEFTGRYLKQQGDDMLPMGGAFAKYVEVMWDSNGPSDPWEYTGRDPSPDGIPLWWREWALDNGYCSIDVTDPDQIGWDTVVEWTDWRGGSGRKISMTAREAYWRDLAAGMMIVNGEVVTNKAEFVQTADVNGDGLADWWENMFGITSAKIADDTDNDGLADYAEYLVSEIFNFAAINPTMPRTSGVRLDYFGKEGRLYYGEVLSDHDFMEDWWESLYSVKNISSGIYDAHKDGDGDGWSNFAESRVGTSPDRVSYLGVDESTMNDFPTPIIRLKCSYKGSQNAAVYPVVVKAFSKRNASTMPDAVWTIASSADSGEVGGDNSDADNESSEAAIRTKHLGMNPGVSVSFNLGPGSVVMGTLSMQLKDLTWESGYYSLNDDGSKNILTSSIGAAGSATWSKHAIDQVRVGDTVFGDIVDIGSATRNIIGQINYQTGEVTIDLSKVADFRFYYTYQLSDGNGNPINRYYFDGLQANESFVRIQYTSKQTTTGYPKTFYLADADVNSSAKPSQGHLYEGENWFEAFVDMDGDGQYSAGEPYGFKRGVDVGWSGTEFEIELTDTSPVFGRFRFDGDSCTCDRVVIHGSEADVYPSSTNEASFATGGIEERVRIVRSKVNGAAVGTSSMKVIADFTMRKALRPYITEADILGSDKFDVEGLGVLMYQNGVSVNEISYAVVIGDGTITADFANVKVAPYEIIRSFGTEAVKPTVVSDGKPTVFYGAQPTFTWNMNGDKSYTSFSLQVGNLSGKIIYDSGIRSAPPLDADGNYTWTPDDLFVDDQSRGEKGGCAIFSNTNQYIWRVQMCNTRFGSTTSAWSDVAPQFRMNANAACEVNDSGYSSIKVCVKYFGPENVRELVRDKTSFLEKIRIEAFSSPDFTGTPVARGFYDDNKSKLTNDDYTANFVLKGVPSGSYYIRAYIDGDGDFERDNWESWGYANRRDMTSGKNIFTPVPVTVGPDVATAPEVRVYIEDVDTDGDWLPDAWEMKEVGNLTAKGPGTFFNENEFQFRPEFLTRFTRVSASGNPLASSLGALSSSSLKSSDMVALLLGVDTAGYATSADAISAAVSPELVEDGVVIESLSIAEGKVTIKVGIETEAAVLPASSIYSITPATTVDVTCNVYVKENLATSEWILAKSEKVTVGGDAVEIDAGAGAGVSGFYKVEVVK